MIDANDPILFPEADRMRRAAAELRRRAERVLEASVGDASSPNAWKRQAELGVAPDLITANGARVGRIDAGWGYAAEYFASVNPPVGLLLAALLEDLAADAEQVGPNYQADALAAAYLGETP